MPIAALLPWTFGLRSQVESVVGFSSTYMPSILAVVYGNVWQKYKATDAKAYRLGDSGNPPDRALTTAYAVYQDDCHCHSLIIAVYTPE